MLLNRKLKEEKNKNDQKDIVIKELKTKVKTLREEKEDLREILDNTREQNCYYRLIFENLEKALKESKYGTYIKLLDFKNKVEKELSSL